MDDWTLEQSKNIVALFFTYLPRFYLRLFVFFIHVRSVQ